MKAGKSGSWEISHLAIALERWGDYLPYISSEIQSLRRFLSFTRPSFHQPRTRWFITLEILKLPFSQGRFSPHLPITHSICFGWSRGDMIKCVKLTCRWCSDNDCSFSISESPRVLFIHGYTEQNLRKFCALKRTWRSFIDVNIMNLVFYGWNLAKGVYVGMNINNV